jgi:hypothetical protein
MSSWATLIVFLVLALISLVIYLAVRYDRLRAVQRQEIARTLGLTPVIPDEALTAQILQIYKWPEDRTEHFKLLHVFHKPLTDAHLYLFDLEQNASEESSMAAQQAIAILAPQAALPQFTIFPKSDVGGVLSRLANEMIQQLTRRYETPLTFPEHPDVARRYQITSREPKDAHAFLSHNLLSTLAQTRLLFVRAYGEGFILTEWGNALKMSDQDVVHRRVALAVQLWQACRRSE